MSVSQPLFDYLDRLGIAHATIEHAPVFTVEDGRDWKHEIPGLHCKNLFMKDAKGRIALAVLPGDKRADIKGIEKKAGLGRLSFGKSDLLKEVLGVEPGSVTPFALINDTDRRVLVILDDSDARGFSFSASPFSGFPRNSGCSTAALPSLLTNIIQSMTFVPKSCHGCSVPCRFSSR